VDGEVAAMVPHGRKALTRRVLQSWSRPNRAAYVSSAASTSLGMSRISTSRIDQSGKYLAAPGLYDNPRLRRANPSPRNAGLIDAGALFSD
jgi:hypothetical protein